MHLPGGGFSEDWCWSVTVKGIDDDYIDGVSLVSEGEREHNVCCWSESGLCVLEKVCNGGESVFISVGPKWLPSNQLVHAAGSYFVWICSSFSCLIRTDEVLNLCQKYTCVTQIEFVLGKMSCTAWKPLRLRLWERTRIQEPGPAQSGGLGQSYIHKSAAGRSLCWAGDHSKAQRSAQTSRCWGAPWIPEDRAQQLDIKCFEISGFTPVSLP